MVDIAAFVGCGLGCQTQREIEIPEPKTGTFDFCPAIYWELTDLLFSFERDLIYK